jgi:hypothetical protein
VRDCDVAAVVVATRKVPEERIARLVQDVGAVGGAVYQFTFRLEPLADADAPQVLTPAAAPPAPAPARRASMLSPRGPATEPMPDAASSVPTT